MSAGRPPCSTSSCSLSERPAEQDRDERIDVCVGCDLRDRHVLQEPGVGGERHERARERPGRRRRAATWPRRRRDAGRSPRRWPGRRPAALHRRRPSASRSRRADRTACSGAARGRIPSPTSLRQRGRAGCRRPWPRRAGCRGAGAAPGRRSRCATPASVPRCTRSRADGRAHEHEPQRDRGDEQRGQPGGHVALGDGHEAVATGREEQADEPRGGEAAGRNAHAVPSSGQEREHGDAGDREARAGSQQRRDVLDHDANGDIGPAPQDVDDAQRRPHPPRGRREGVAGAGC